MASGVEYDFQKPSQPPATAPSHPPPFDPSQPPPTATSQPPVVTGIPVTPPNFDNKPQPPVPVGVETTNVAGDWSTGLCDCFEDVGSCCLTFWCPCISFGFISEIVDRGTSSCALNGVLYFLIAYLLGCPCLYSCFYRSKLRQQYRLTESPCNDCLVHCCCEPCALCQEYRELKHRGFDVTIGWHANEERGRGNPGITMAPIVQGGMSR